MIASNGSGGVLIDGRVAELFAEYEIIGMAIMRVAIEDGVAESTLRSFVFARRAITDSFAVTCDSVFPVTANVGIIETRRHTINAIEIVAYRFTFDKTDIFIISISSFHDR